MNKYFLAVSDVLILVFNYAHILSYKYYSSRMKAFKVQELLDFYEFRVEHYLKHFGLWDVQKIKT